MPIDLKLERRDHFSLLEMGLDHPEDQINQADKPTDADAIMYEQFVDYSRNALNEELVLSQGSSSAYLVSSSMDSPSNLLPNHQDHTSGHAPKHRYSRRNRYILRSFSSFVSPEIYWSCFRPSHYNH